MNVKNITDLIANVDVACVFARSKTMKRLLRDLEHPSDSAILPAILGIGGIVWGGVATGFGWLSPDAAAVLSASGSFVAVFGCVMIRMSRFERYKKQAQESGVCVINGANENASATIKMNAIDECGKILPPEQMDVLKAIAKREDVPLGWWQNVTETVREYHAHTIKKHNEHNIFLSEQRAQERLASLSTVAVAQPSCTASQHKDPKRLMV